MILLPAQPHSNLDWNAKLEEARSFSKKIIWEFDLGLEDPYFPLEDELRFQTLALALTQFTKEVWPLFHERTEGAILFGGSADFTPYFSWTERQEENFAIWKAGRTNSLEHLRRIFCAEAFISYFQMLSHRLPDELALILHLDVERGGTLAEKLHLVSSMRFEHFQLVIRGLPDSSDARIGVCFPEDEACTTQVLERLDALLLGLRGVKFKAISESLLTQEWDGLDSLYVLTDALSPRGRRKLMGFCAAGGTVISEGPSLGLPNERNRGRGI